jgi:ketosteroid isomerase-like protein
MASHNVEVVRNMLEAYASGGVDAVLPFIHDDFHGEVPPEVSAEPDSYDGPDGVRRYFDLFAEVIDDLAFEPYEFIEAGDRVMTVSRLRGRGKGSGIPVEMEAFNVAEVRGDKLAAMWAYGSRDAALAALGDADHVASLRRPRPRRATA